MHASCMLDHEANDTFWDAPRVWELWGLDLLHFLGTDPLTLSAVQQQRKSGSSLAEPARSLPRQMAALQ